MPKFATRSNVPLKSYLVVIKNGTQHMREYVLAVNKDEAKSQIKGEVVDVMRLYKL